MCVYSSQEVLFSSTNGTVASNEDDAVELMMYRQNGSWSDVVPVQVQVQVSDPDPVSDQDPPTSGSQGPAEPLADRLEPAERGEAPPLREAPPLIEAPPLREVPPVSVSSPHFLFLSDL